MAEPFISGYALQWQQPATIAGLFVERFARGSFDRSLRDNPDVAALWSHDSSRPLGRVGNGTLTLKPDSIGLWYALTPNPDSPSGQEALASVGRADVGQVSVGFSSVIEEWTDADALPSRLITEARLHEISLVLWAAYGDATSASLSRAADNSAAALRRIALRKAEDAMRLRGIR
ncbi:HK97 family phage prohead protease [Mesorhizobium sp. M0674]|uniref:HK97 family phage prohead protease n=1 Tax=unclassified Mesorhizobium TaxID=325217 RepID=UPI003337A28A